MANAKGRLAEAYTGTGSPKITDLGFSYSPRGEAADLWQWSTNSGGWYHVAGAYWPTGPTGLLNTLTAPGLPVFTYNPDGEGRVGSVQAGSASLVSGTQYNDFRSGWLPMVVNLGAAGSGDKDTFTFDTNTGRMSQYMATLANNSSLTGTLTWNGNGSLAQLGIVDQFYPANNQTCSYTHDELARISKVDCGNGFWGQTFAYNDAFGNVTKAGIVGRQGGSYTPTYSPSTNQISCTGCGYDSNGNLTADAPQPGGHTYAWDAEGKLSQYNGGAALVYDALGRRVEQPGAQILYGLGGGKLALMSGQAVTKAFVPLPGGATAVYNGGTLTYYRHADWLGSSRLASKSSDHTVYYDGSYEPFGQSYGESGTVDHSFTGQNQDLVPNFLYDFPAREYQPGTSRWLSPDPAGLAAVDLANPQSWNRYAYVNNSPLNSVDPLGLANVVDCTPGKYQNKLCEAHVQESVLHLGAEADKGVYGAALFWANLLGVQSITLWSPTQYTAPEGFTVTIVGSGTDSWEDPGSSSATQELTDALVAFVDSGPKNIEYGPDNPFTRDFMKSAAMDAINAKITSNCSAASGNVAVGTGEAFVNTMIDGAAGGEGFYTPEAQLGAFNAAYTRGGGMVDITVTNPISLNSLLFHLPAALGISNPKTGSFGTVHQTLHIHAIDPCH